MDGGFEYSAELYGTCPYGEHGTYSRTRLARSHHLLLFQSGFYTGKLTILSFNTC